MIMTVLVDPIQILHMDQEEPEALSEGDDYGMDQTNNELQEFFGLADAFLNREGPGSVFIQRRRNGGKLLDQHTT